jgi:hypothetical protein
MLAKEKILSIFICDPITPNIYQARKPIVEKMDSCFGHHLKGHLIFLTFI